MIKQKDKLTSAQALGAKYQELWDELKSKETMILDSPKKSHKTILQALRRKSVKDSVFRFKCVERGVSYTIGYNSVNDTLFIRLEWKNTIPKKFTYK